MQQIKIFRAILKYKCLIVTKEIIGFIIKIMITVNIKYFDCSMKKHFELLSKTFLYRTYGSYQKSQRSLEIEVANKIPKIPQYFPSKTDKAIFSIALNKIEYFPYLNKPVVFL